jgi:hypothetical protein
MNLKDPKFESRINPQELSIFFLIATALLRRSSDLSGKAEIVSSLITARPLFRDRNQEEYSESKILLIIDALKTFIKSLEEYVQQEEGLFSHEKEPLTKLVSDSIVIKEIFEEKLKQKYFKIQKLIDLSTGSNASVYKYPNPEWKDLKILEHCYKELVFVFLRTKNNVEKGSSAELIIDDYLTQQPIKTIVDFFDFLFTIVDDKLILLPEKFEALTGNHPLALKRLRENYPDDKIIHLSNTCSTTILVKFNQPKAVAG